MAKLKNSTIEKLKSEKRIFHIPVKESYDIQVATLNRMEEYSREYSKKDKASHIAASKVLLTS
ncbi:MAG TPA: hypothetical protein ENN33_11750 [Ignavibacteria bacterium]|nr:hypothetical protein [Ignavibacteria bacterium]